MLRVRVNAKNFKKHRKSVGAARSTARREISDRGIWKRGYERVLRDSGFWIRDLGLGSRKSSLNQFTAVLFNHTSCYTLLAPDCRNWKMLQIQMYKNLCCLMANYCNNIDYVHLNKRKKKVLNRFPQTTSRES